MRADPILRACGGLDTARTGRAAEQWRVLSHALRGAHRLGDVRICRIEGVACSNYYAISSIGMLVFDNLAA
jgi:hypothetical protein